MKKENPIKNLPWIVKEVEKTVPDLNKIGMKKAKARYLIKNKSESYWLNIHNQPLKETEHPEHQKALLTYAEDYNFKKKKSSRELQLEDNTRRLYVIYARKSTEDEERQKESIEDQIQHCKEFAKREGLEVVEIISEEKSAKKPGRRLRFQEMLANIRGGKLYNSILAWHPDRLARNMKDSGEILEMLDENLILDLKFPSYTFSNDTAGKMTLSILFAMAKEFSDKLSDDTKRGIKKKAKEGRHCGSSKRGYCVNNDGYYRPDTDKFQLYAKAWEEYKGGYTQKEILKNLKAKGEDITKNALSNFFKDPFYAGIYCYGNHITSLKSVDTKFQPMISAEDFIKIQKENRENPRGWKKSEEFRPFRDFVICNDCKKIMTPGVSKGKTDKYLSLTCGNSKCKESRKEKGIKPIANTSRGYVIVDFCINYLNKNIEMDRKLFNKIKELYFKEKNSLIKENSEEMRILKTKKSKYEEKSRKVTKKIVDLKGEEELQKNLTLEFNVLNSQIRLLDKDIKELESKNKGYKLDIDMEIPKYEDFLNFFKKIVPAIQKTNDAYLTDQLIKLIFLNTTAGEKKVVDCTLNEPFKTYFALKITSGVDDGT